MSGDNKVLKAEEAGLHKNYENLFLQKVVAERFCRNKLACGILYPNFVVFHRKAMWGPEAEGVLIDFYDKHRYLWDIHHPNYFKRDLKEQSLEQLAQTLGPTYTATEVKRKWKHIRDGYMRKRKTLLAMKHSGTGAKYIQRFMSKWENYHRLRFLLDTVVEKANGASASNPEAEESQQDSLMLSFETLETQEMHSEVPQEHRHLDSPLSPARIKHEVLSPCPSTSSTSEDSQSLSLQRNIVPRKRKNHAMNNAKEELMLSVVKCLKPVAEDRLDCFGKYIAALLRELPSTAQDQAQLEIVTLLMQMKNESR